MIEPRYKTLQSLFADRVFRIPVYQRFYSWQKRQRADLFSDLEKLANDSTDQSSDRHHFMATIVCNRTDEKKAIGAAEYVLYDVVDGQQRLTTLILLLKCIEFELPADSADKVELAGILVKRDGLLLLLQTNNVNADLFNTFIRDGKIAEKKDVRLKSDLNLISAIHECAAFVKQWRSSSDLVSLMHLILHRLGFVVFDTDDARAVYTLFEVLNSRGLAVDWLDKTKSTLMGRAFELSPNQIVAQTAINDLQKLWGGIYQEIAEENVSGDEILRTTSTLYYGSEQGKPRSAEGSLDSIREACKSQGDPGQITKRLLTVAKVLTGLYQKPQLKAVTEILHSRILYVALQLAQGVSNDERKMLVEEWERVTFRIFGLLQKDSRTKVGDYTRLASRIVKGDATYQTFNQIMAPLHKLGSEYPVEDAVREGLRGRNLYDTSPEVCRYILWNYEESLAQAMGPNATVDQNERTQIWHSHADDTIEHILPQNAGAAWQDKRQLGDPSLSHDEEYVHRIGNLLLLPQPLNSAAGAHSFSDKKKKYKQHHLRMIDEVCALDDWTRDSIVEREERLTTWAEKRWSDV